jgi:hypothetical protein
MLKDGVIYRHNPGSMTNNILDKEGNTLNEKVEVIVDKAKLQLFGWAVGALLSILSFTLLQVYFGIQTLKENSEDFKTYIKTNDQRFQYFEKRYEDHIDEFKELKARVKELENASN